MMFVVGCTGTVNTVDPVIRQLLQEWSDWDLHCLLWPLSVRIGRVQNIWVKVC